MHKNKNTCCSETDLNNNILFIRSSLLEDTASTSSILNIDRISLASGYSSIDECTETINDDFPERVASSCYVNPGRKILQRSSVNLMILYDDLYLSILLGLLGF